MAQSQKARLARIFTRLGETYGKPVWERSGPALDSLILTVLSQNTNDRNSLEGFRRLKAAFPDWGTVERAHWTKVAAAIRVSGLANVKSRRIQTILKQVRAEHGGYSLEGLNDWPTDKAREYLTAMPGVGPKTAACVLMFSFGKPVFPVDTHIHRVTRRLGLIDAKVSAEQAHDILQSMCKAEWVYPLHLLIIRHGRTVCHARNPVCGQCPLLRMCPTGKGTVSDNGGTSGVRESRGAWSMWDEMRKD